MHDLSTSINRQTGEWLSLTTGDLALKSFVPFALPPTPPLAPFEDLQARANRAPRGLDQIAFLTGVHTVAEGAAQTAQRLIALFKADRQKIEQKHQRTSGTLIRVHEVLKRKIMLSTNDVIEQTGLTRPTAIAAFAKLSELGITREMTGKKRNTAYVYPAYLEILSEGAEPL